MPVATYIQKGQKNVQSKYHRVKERIELTCGLIQVKVFSKFHEGTHINIHPFKISRESLSYLKDKLPSLSSKKRTIVSTAPHEIDLSLASQCSISNEEKICWTRRRFQGKVHKIILKDGLIVEKIFSTTNGSEIRVKRCELGVAIRCFF
ncbi:MULTISPECIES: hypothetical protein [unclassified Prochlorococcus]|uniref:hypothetical protein n=1 Tax=unclassified Prochlorococcus TaxID=2627481 RepID=UPI000533A6C5|nr:MULTISPECIES: hypothetical protein [unclassified Prochlorococcus]KGG15537.1 hypothetical protein EV06_1411 [Prochlorococcus sp. MIT 0602]KGG17817.1 hypothetical protein EV07_1259 [Prochlorococcus sp. MIT 0603]